MEYRVLGSLEVIDGGGRSLPLGGARQRTVLASLLLRAEHTVALERLIDELWEEPPRTAAKTVQVYVSRLRHELPKGAIEGRPGGYALLLHGDGLDVRQFERYAEEGRTALAAGDCQRAAQLLVDALALWRGPAFAGLRSEAVRREAERLEELRLQVLEDRTEADLGCGRQREVVPELQAFVVEHPFRERPRAQLMLALYRSGRQRDALALYGETRRLLVEELGMEPGEPLRELERAILRGDPALDLPSRDVASDETATTLDASVGARRASRAGRPGLAASSTPSVLPNRLPTGTVTFLFTDVEGSTRVVRELGADRYAHELTEHRRALREVIARYGGVEVDTQGDAFFIAFARASAAVAAAEEGERALHDSPLRFRAGIHTGEPSVVEEGYVGLDVQRAARIASAGHGGQVLVSQTTRDLLEEDVALRDLGRHRLKDLGEPLQLYQLGHGEFPPLRSLNWVNLPVQPTRLIGRERELDEAGRLLRAHHLVTLTGAGGSGKTRLALQLAAEAVEDFPDGVFWVPLQALRDPDLVLPTIARTVGANGRLAEWVADRHMLLLLDNLEHLIAAAPELGDLLGQMLNLKLLVTSREPLHIGAEHEYPVEPLCEREAAALFIERARSVKPDFAEEETVVEICRRLDCLPLALELAAARVKALSTEDLLKRLDRRLPLLTGGPRDAPERQRTLRATIAWSYDLLGPEEQRLFGRLAVFAGGCALEAIEEVCEANLDTLAALIDKSLVRREGDRYSLLETIGEYALERLEERGELEELRRRHAEYYLELARSVEGLVRSPKAAVLLDRLGRDYENLRAGLGWLSGLDPDEDPDRPLHLAVWGLAARLHTFGDAALDHRNYVDAAHLYRESLEIGLQLKDDLQTLYCLAGLAAVCAQQGRGRLAARLWGFVGAFERTSGTRLHAVERMRYERLLDALARLPDTSTDFAEGSAMSLNAAVEYALANVE